MLRNNLMLGARYPAPAEFVGAAQSNGINVNTDPLTKPAGIAVGDVLIASCLGPCLSTIPRYPASGGGAWANIEASTWAGAGYKSQIAWKVCQPGDLVGDWYADFGMAWNDNIQIVAYRGGSQVTIRSQLTNPIGLSSLALPGIPPSADCRKLVSIIADRDVGALLTAPAGFAARLNGPLGAFQHAAADIDPRDYIDNATVTWTDTFDGPGFWETGYLLEIT